MSPLSDEHYKSIQLALQLSKDMLSSHTTFSENERKEILRAFSDMCQLLKAMKLDTAATQQKMRPQMQLCCDVD